jgi:hypothetical protein
MKKLILALLAVSAFGTANAQKNSILVYGNLGINTAKTDNGNGSESRNLNWNINPGVGYQFTNCLTIGLQGGINSQFSETRNSPVLNTWNRSAAEYREWQVGAFFRHTKHINNIFSVFAQLDLSYVSGQNVSENETRMVNNTTNTIVETVIYGYDYYNGFQANIAPMIAANIGNGLALNFGIGGLGYRTISYDAPKSPTALNPVLDQSSFMFTFGKQYSFGISKNFACKKRTGNVKPGDDMRPMKMQSNDDDE